MSQKVVSESVSDEDTAAAAEAVVVRHESIPNKGQTRTGKKLTTISSAFQKPFACNALSGQVRKYAHYIHPYRKQRGFIALSPFYSPEHKQDLIFSLVNFLNSLPASLIDLSLDIFLIFL